LVVAAGLTYLDLWTKGLWEYSATPGPARVKTLIEDWLYIRPILNPGGIWSLDLPGWVLTGATALAVPLLLVWLFRPLRASAWESAGKVLILGGALGNLYDRIFYGAVRDFIDAYLWGWNYPVFNVADIVLVVGIGVLLICSFREGRKERREAAA